MKKLVSCFLFVLLFLVCYSQELSPKEIIRKAEEKTRGVTSSYSEMSITTIRKTWTREMSMKSWSKGQDYSLILITSPAKDAGSATLRRNKEVWSWIPTIERTLKLPPSMMSQSWMGTDLTNDDLVRESSNVTDYNHQLLEDSVINGIKCYKIELIPKEGVAVVWGKVIAFIDKTDYIQLKTEMYDEDGYLINIMLADDIKTMAGIQMATRMEFIPVEKEGQKTVINITKMEFDIAIDESFFTIQNMKRIK